MKLYEITEPKGIDSLKLTERVNSQAWTRRGPDSRARNLA